MTWRKLYSALERLVPKRQLYCFISYPDCADNAYALYRHLRLTGSSEELIWLVQDEASSLAKLRARLPEFKHRVIKKNSLSGFWCFLRASRILFTHGHFRFVTASGTGKLINLWHGMPIKVIAALDPNTRQIQASDYVIATSQYFAPIMSAAFQVAESHVLVVGNPRCDLLQERSEAALAFSKRVRGDRFSRFVVYMPTYRISEVGDVRADTTDNKAQVLSMFERQVERIRQSAEAAGVALVVKLHPMDFLNSVSTKIHRDVTLITRDDMGPEGLDVYELLSESSGLLSDVSSVLIDYAVTRRPIGVIVEGVDSYSRGTTFDFHAVLGDLLISDDRALTQFFASVAGRVGRPVPEFLNDQSHSCERLANWLEISG